ncbi:MAG TPA: hypothetical protein VKZ18_29440 [Polyangia bacterium]|nr:hypothetical protein [Polyangia bacterium]
MRLFVLALSVMMCLAACGGTGGGSPAKVGTLDCAFLASDNCWKMTAAAAVPCLPAASEVGIFSADGTTCTYASGEVITFIQPLVLPLSQAGIFDLTVKGSDGTTCLAYQDDGFGNITLTVQGQTVRRLTNTYETATTLQCPDGTSYQNEKLFSPYVCLDAGDVGLPGSNYAISPSSLTLWLDDTPGSTYGQPIFSCELAPT